MPILNFQFNVSIKVEVFFYRFRVRLVTLTEQHFPLRQGSERSKDEINSRIPLSGAERNRFGSVILVLEYFIFTPSQIPRKFEETNQNKRIRHVIICLFNFFRLV